MEIYIKLFEVLFPVFFIVGIGYFIGKKNPNLDTDAEWNKAVKDWNDNYEGTFSMLKSFNTYNEEIAGYCKLQLFLLNGVTSENKKNNIEKDF